MCSNWDKFQHGVTEGFILDIIPFLLYVNDNTVYKHDFTVQLLILQNQIEAYYAWTKLYNGLPLKIK
jgi:hypothetical protein